MKVEWVDNAANSGIPLSQAARFKIRGIGKISLYTAPSKWASNMWRWGLSLSGEELESGYADRVEQARRDAEMALGGRMEAAYIDIKTILMSGEDGDRPVGRVLEPEDLEPEDDE